MSYTLKSLLSVCRRLTDNLAVKGITCPTSSGYYLRKQVWLRETSRVLTTSIRSLAGPDGFRNEETVWSQLQ